MDNKDNSKHCYLFTILHPTHGPQPSSNPGNVRNGTLQNVLFVQYVFLATEQAETHPKIYVFIYHLTYICPSFFGWKGNMIFEETVTGYFEWV